MAWKAKEFKKFDICEKKYREITSTRNIKDAVVKCARRRRWKQCQERQD